MAVLTLLIDGIIGYVFLSAAWNKGMSFVDFRLSLDEYRLWPWMKSPYAAGLLVGLEAMLGFLFVSGRLPVWRESLAIGALAIFLMLLIGRKSGTSRGCSCFGRSSALNRYPVRRNAVLIAICAAGMALPAREPSFEAAALLSLAVAAGIYREGRGYGLGRTRRAYASYVSLFDGIDIPNEPSGIVLCLSASDLDEADRVLSLTTYESIFVVFSGPAWLAELKRKKWSGHSVVPAPSWGSGESVLLAPVGAKIVRIKMWLLYLRKMAVKSAK